MKINIKEAKIKTATVDVKTLAISGKQVTLSVFRQLIKDDLINLSTGELNGIPWGNVNYFWGDCEDDHLHVVWKKGDELRRDCLFPKFPVNTYGFYGYDIEKYQCLFHNVLQIIMLRRVVEMFNAGHFGYTDKVKVKILDKEYIVNANRVEYFDDNGIRKIGYCSVKDYLCYPERIKPKKHYRPVSESNNFEEYMETTEEAKKRADKESKETEYIINNIIGLLHKFNKKIIEKLCIEIKDSESHEQFANRILIEYNEHRSKYNSVKLKYIENYSKIAKLDQLFIAI